MREKELMQYTREVSDLICQQLAAGRTLRSICQAEDMPSREAVRKWVLADTDGFAERYEQARMLGYETLEDEIIDLSDDAGLSHEAVGKARLQVDSRKWLLAKSLPKRYGDRTILAGDRDAPLAVAVEDNRPPIDTLIAAALAKVERQPEGKPTAEERPQAGTPQQAERELPRIP